ncbi:MAG: hypothetical protein LBP33_06220 [Candidatus Adiutrix sp.]|jgi:hypothetical protein|nr:hypothetical protein [Candidatus Adiutrix sp.]
MSKPEVIARLEDLENAVAGGPTPHNTSHQAGGSDALTPAMIGALPAEGTAVAAQKLATARVISLTGPVTGTATFDGSKDIIITTDLTGDLLIGVENLGARSGNVVADVSLSVEDNTIYMTRTYTTANNYSPPAQCTQCQCDCNG